MSDIDLMGAGPRGVGAACPTTRQRAVPKVRRRSAAHGLHGERAMPRTSRGWYRTGGEAMSAMERCKHCGKRIFLDRKGPRDVNPTWRHYGYAQRECDGLRLKYAEPRTEGENRG